ncbi:MAG: hypothetical protein COA33_015150 [Fluviicola sp.]|nr:hypothetical protein [Fluviicola sp.]
MKILFTVLMLCVGGQYIYGQNYQAAVEIPEYNFMYRFYDNKVEVAVNDVSSSDIEVECSACKIEKVGEGYIVKPTGSSRELYLSVFVKGKDSSTLVKRIKYRVTNLPDPELYWGKAKNNTKANSRDYELFAKYPPGIPLHSNFKILDWTLETPNDTISGSGSNITSAQGILKKITEPTTITFKITVVGPDGIRRKKTGTWNVDPWDK